MRWGCSAAMRIMSSGSTSTGSYPSLALVTAWGEGMRSFEFSAHDDQKCRVVSEQSVSHTLRPLLPWGRYESRFTQCRQSMCTA